MASQSNRHGMIAGATGTGKTVTLPTLAEGFSKMGVPVFIADVKDDLSGMHQPADEILKTQTDKGSQDAAEAEKENDDKSFDWGGVLGKRKGRSQSRCSDSVLESTDKSLARAVGSSLGRVIIRGILGTILGRC